MTPPNTPESFNTNLNNVNDPGHSLGIAGLVLALVGITPIGLALSIMAYKESKSVGIKNGLALAGIWLNSIFLAITLLIAIAVFLVTFLALPNLQTSQRDVQRKNDTGQFITAITNYADNNRGQLPTDSNLTDGLLISDYILPGYDTYDDNGEPIRARNAWDGSSGEKYSIKTSGEPDIDSFVFTRGEDCDGITGDHKASVRIMLETSGEYCQSY